MPDPAATPSPPPTSPPDWPSISDEISCPLCSYNLRGLAEPRCPECGHRFEWGPLIEPTTSRHTWLFEHQPRHNTWSFFQTLRRGLCPRRFWLDVRPAHGLRLGRLILYWFLCCLLYLTLTPVQEVIHARVTMAVGNADARLQMQRMNPRLLTRRHWDPQAVQQQIDRSFPLPPDPIFFQNLWKSTITRLSYPQVWLFPAVIFLAWPWLTLLTLLLFRGSMRLGRVRPAHLTRCVLYTSDAIVWYILLLIALDMLAWLIMAFTGPQGQAWSLHWRTMSYMPLLLILIRTYRLGIAGARYLGLPHAMALMIAAQVVMFLSIAVAMYLLSRMYWQ